MQTYKTIREIHDAFDSGKASPLSLTQEYFQQIESSRHNAWITLCKERALRQKP